MLSAEMQMSRGQILRRLRETRGMGLVEMAQPAKIDKDALSRAEKDDPTTSFNTLRKAARFLGVTVEYLETGGGLTPPVTIGAYPPANTTSGGTVAESAKARLQHLVASLTEEEAVMLLQQARRWLAILAQKTDAEDEP